MPSSDWMRAGLQHNTLLVEIENNDIKIELAFELDISFEHWGEGL